MAGWLWKSLRRLYRSFPQCSGREFQDEMRQTHLGDGVSKMDWSELPVGVPSQDVVTSIEKSKEHWSELPVDAPGSTDSEILAESEIQARNQTSWKGLQDRNPSFFQDWCEKVQVGQQIAEGGQAKIYEATWKDEHRRLGEYIDMPDRMVVKVFKLEGCTLEDFVCQWPRINATSHELLKRTFMQFASNVSYSYVCPIVGAYFLKDNRFAFLMKRYTCDLRSLLQKKMQDNKGRGPPFPDRQDEMYVLLCIAKGMRWLHGHGVLHRDLKASNVLVNSVGCGYNDTYAVADYECSMATIGTGFWRAPEVLQEMLHRSGRNVDIWTTKSDVYSFGMICFEVLTGGIPFPEYSKKDWTEIIDRHKRPELPDYVDFDLQQLVKRCWDKDPSERPSFHDIVEELEKLEKSLEFTDSFEFV